MVVSICSSLRPWSLLTVLLLPFLVTLETVGAQEGPRPEERTRVGLTAVASEEVARPTVSRVRGSASNILAHTLSQALFVDAPAERFVTDGAPNLSAAKDALLDLLLLIVLGPQENPEEGEHRLTLQLFDVRAGERLGTIETTVSIGRLGRYLRSSSWEESVSALAPFIEAYRPFTEVVVLTEPGARISWGDAGETEASEEGRAVISVRNMRSYHLVAQRHGFRSEATTVFVEREPMEVTLDLLSYPRWLVELTLAGVSFPRVGGGRFIRETSLYLYGEFTSRAVGFTPFIQLNRNEDEDDPRLFSFYPLSEFALGADLFLRSRDKMLRPSLGVQLFGRFVHADYFSGFDPLLPAGLAIRLGAQRELGEHFFFLVNLDSRFYYLREPAFVAPYDSTYRIGDLPTLWQPATLSVGGRYAP